LQQSRGSLTDGSRPEVADCGLLWLANSPTRFLDMRRIAPRLLLVCLVALLEPAWAGAWGRTFAIEVHGDTLAKPLVITDSAIVDELSFWVGPGTGYSEFMGLVKLELSIVAWDRGEATDRPTGLDTYEVRFLLEPRADPPAFIVCTSRIRRTAQATFTTTPPVRAQQRHPASSGRFR
jgi:hypothetical protein